MDINKLCCIESLDPQHVVLAYESGILKVLDLRNAQEIKEIQSYANPENKVVCLKRLNKNEFFVGCKNGWVCKYNKQGKLIGKFKNNNSIQLTTLGVLNQTQVIVGGDGQGRGEIMDGMQE